MKVFHTFAYFASLAVEMESITAKCAKNAKER